MTSFASPAAPVSWGELLDKVTILEIKRERITRPDAQRNIAKELAVLAAIAAPALRDAEVARLHAELCAVNTALWDIEDAIRAEDARGAFGAEFVTLARSVYRRNDERAALKRAINTLLASDLVEEKSYTAFASVENLREPAPIG